MQGVFAETLLRKEGRVGCVHQNIFTRKVTDIAFPSDFCNNHSLPPRPCIWRPASPSHMSPRPILDVPKSLVSRPQVTSPPTCVPMSPSPCPRPTLIHNLFLLSRWVQIGIILSPFLREMLTVQKLNIKHITFLTVGLVVDLDPIVRRIITNVS